MPSYVTPKKNTAYITYITLPDAALAYAFKANPTLAAGDAKVSIDGGAFANLATLPAVTPASGKGVKVSLSSAEMNGDNILVVLSDQTVPPEWSDYSISLQTSARQVDDLASQTSVDTVDDIVDAILVDTGTTLDGNLTAVKNKTDNLPSDPADQSLIIAATDAIIAAIGAVPSADDNATALLDQAAGVETGRTLRESIRLILAAAVGKISGAATATVTIRDTNDSKDRIVATVDTAGNRTAVTLDDT